MTNFSAIFKHQTGVIPFIIAGDPDADTTVASVVAEAEAGAAIVELGVPFSDPVADGPVVKAGNQRAFAGGITVAKVFDIIARIRLQTQVPLVLVTYTNVPFVYGYAAFAKKAASFGVAGVVVPDLPHEEAADFRAALAGEGIDLITIVGPADPERIKAVVAPATGFLTVFPAPPEPVLSQEIAAIRAASDLPVVVNAEVTQPQAVEAIAKVADGVQLNAAFVQLIADHADAKTVADYTKRLVSAVTTDK